MLGVQFQYYVMIDIPTFKKIVDALGGVWMEIPNIINGGIYYSDPEQGLEIALPAGMMYLDGDKAEQLVRYRHDYANGDLGRNAVQIEFITQLVRQAMTREAIMNDPISLINTLLNDVRTNLGADIIKYTPYIPKFSGENIKTFTLPGTGPTINGVSYFLPDPEALPNVVNEVFYAVTESKTAAADGDEGKQTSSLRIQVLNATRVAGLASTLSDTLRYNGYNVVNIDTYTGSRQSATRILARNELDGAELLPYFKKAEVALDGNIPSEYDIVIIIGQSEG
jgi:anionic cell wall polymer biosynthesis LytR-Cps2A-Psr (LCP) family protein